MSERDAARDEGYERVREALRSRGYLEAPLERLFAGTATGSLGSGWGGLVLAALLAGAVGGIALGALLAVLLVGQGRVPAWPDGALYGLLFAPVLGVGVAIAELVAGIAVRGLARVRPGLAPRRAALVAGAVTAIAVAVYVGGWWARSGAEPSPGGVLGLLALALAAGLIGRLVAAAALVHAALASGRVPRRAGRPALGLVALAVVITAMTAAGSIGWSRARGRLAPPVARDGGAPAPLVVVGWDGLDRDLALALARTGDVPWLAGLEAGGALFPVRPVGRVHPAASWISVATGCPPEVHGVLGAELSTLRGAEAPAPRAGLVRGPLELLERLWPTRQGPLRAGVRDRPAAWEITADAARTAVVGWWGTWPASAPGRAGGYVVSDGALVALRAGVPSGGRAIWPASFGAGRASGWLERAQRRAAEAIAGEDAAAGTAREALMTDLFALAALEDALADPDLGAAFVYLPGLDILRERWHRQAVDAVAALGAARRHARVVGARLGALLETLPAGALVALAGLPGRVGIPPGIGALAGPQPAGLAASRLASAPEPVGATRLVGLWLALAGYTLDDRICDLDGRWLHEVAGLEAEIRRTAATPAAPEPGGRDLEPELLDRLRSLGYVD